MAKVCYFTEPHRGSFLFLQRQLSQREKNNPYPFTADLFYGKIEYKILLR